MNASTDQGLVSASDIADIAGVSRGAVSNWRRRKEDTFPQPVAGSTAKPLFSRQDVNAWLEAHGYTPKQNADTTAVWAAMNQLYGELSADEASDLVLSLLIARKNGGSDERQLEFQLEQLPWNRRHQVQDAIARVDGDRLASVADFVLERLARSLGKVGGEFGFVGSRTTRTLATLAASRPPGGVLYDPACGIAAALLEAVSLGAKPRRIIGHDINKRALHIAAQRAELHDVEVELVRTDVLSWDVDPSLRADTIILEPPFGVRWDPSSSLMDARFEFGTPPRARADMAWPQHVVAHLSETGRGYVLTPVGALFRSGAEGKIRAELLRRGCLEAIVGLPGKMLPQTAIPLALWVLRRPAPTPLTGQVLFIDASQTDAPENHVADWLNKAAARQNVPHVEVPVGDVLTAEAVLTPSLWVEQTGHEPGEAATAYANGWAGINTTLQELGHIVAGFEDVTGLSTSRTMTVGELIEQRVLDLRTGRPKERYRDAPPALRGRLATAGDVRDGTLRETGLAQAIDAYPEMTRPGDVLATTMHTIRARVDEVGGHLPSTGVYRLRVLNTDVLSPAYLAIALTGTWNERFQAGTTIQRAEIRHLQIPLLPPEDQHTIEQAVTSIARLHDAATRLADDTATARNALLDAVRYNAPLTTPPPAAGSVVDTRKDGSHAPEGTK